MPSEMPVVDERAGILDHLATGVNRWFETHRNLYLTICSALCLVVFAGYSHFRVLFADEGLSLIVIRLANPGQIWRALNEGVRADPPMLYWIGHLLFGVFGDHLFLARLPAVVGFCSMCLCLPSLCGDMHRGSTAPRRSLSLSLLICGAGRLLLYPTVSCWASPL